MTLRKKIFLNNFIFFLILCLSFFALYFLISKKMKNDVHELLTGKTEMAMNLLKSTVDSSVKNFLRGAAEKNREIVEYFANQVKNGKMKESEARKQAAEILMSQKIGKSGYFYVLNSKGVVLIHPSAKLVGVNTAEKFQFVRDQIKVKEGYLEYQWKNPGEEQERPKALYMTYFPEWDWIISASSYKDEFYSLLDLNEVQQKLAGQKVGETGYLVVFDKDVNFVVHPKLHGQNGKDFQDSNGFYFMREIAEKKNGHIFYHWKNPGEKNARQKFAYFLHYPEMNWIIMASSYTDEVYGTVNDSLKLMLGILLVSLVMIGILTPLFSRSVLKPVNQMQKVMTEMAKGEGDLTRMVTIKTRDEMQSMGNSLNQFLSKLKVLIQNLKQQSQALVHTAEELSSNSQQTAASVQEITASSQSVFSNAQKEKTMVQESSKNVLETLSAIKSIYQHTQESNSAISQASTAVEEMAANIASSADMAKRGDEASQKLIQASQEGTQAMSILSESIEEVSKNSSQIVEMVQLIMDISEQTNLLAMNAAIEAAHAGEYGKGFAVVAEEIRKLADKSSRSAKDIQSVVKTISDSIQKNLGMADKTNSTFNLLKKIIEEVKQISHEISSAMDEQKGANQSILQSVERIQEMGNEIAGKTEEETQRGQKVNENLSQLALMSEEIATAMDEQKTGLEEASISSEDISGISNRVREIANRIQEDFKRFKTE